MELADFVKEALVQIVRGIEEAIAETEKTTAHINPRNIRVSTSDAGPYGCVTSQTKHLRPVEAIDFDVAVTVSKATSANDTGHIGVVSTNFDTQPSVASRTDSISRLRFRVPVALPASKKSMDLDACVEAAAPIAMAGPTWRGRG